MARHHSALPHILQHARSIILCVPAQNMHFCFSRVRGKKNKQFRNEWLRTSHIVVIHTSSLISQRNNKAQITCLPFGVNMKVDLLSNDFFKWPAASCQNRRHLTKECNQIVVYFADEDCCLMRRWMNQTSVITTVTSALDFWCQSYFLTSCSSVRDQRRNAY